MRLIDILHKRQHISPKNKQFGVCNQCYHTNVMTKIALPKIKNMKQVFFIINLIATVLLHVGAQDTVFLTKNELIQKVTQQNLQTLLDKAAIKSADADILQTRAMYLPNVTASYTATSTNNPLMAFGSKLNQARVAASDFNPAYLNHPDDITNFATKLELQQPIINMDAVYQKKAALVKVDALRMKSERTNEYLQMEISRAYMQLQLATKAVQVLNAAKKTTLENKRTIDNYFNNGLIQKPDVLYMDIRVAEINNQLQQAKSNVKNASDYIYFLINEDGANSIIQPKDELLYAEKNNEIPASINNSRKDIQAYSKSLKAYDYMIQSAKSRFLPRLNAFGSYEVYDKDPVGFNASGYLVGIQLSWNVFDGLKSKSEQVKYKSEADKVKLEVEQYTKQSQLEMNKAYRQMIDANNKVSTSKLAWEQSKEAYRIRKNRFDQGLEKPADLLNAETFMSQKELEYYQSVYEYNSATEYYQFLK